MADERLEVKGQLRDLVAGRQRYGCPPLTWVAHAEPTVDLVDRLDDADGACVDVDVAAAQRL